METQVHECVLELVAVGINTEQAESMAALMANPASQCQQLERVAQQLTQVPPFNWGWNTFNCHSLCSTRRQ